MAATKTSRPVAVKHQYAPVTDKQRSYLDFLARRAGYRSIADARRARMGKSPVGDLKRAEASATIEWLS